MNRVCEVRAWAGAAVVAFALGAGGMAGAQGAGIDPRLQPAPDEFEASGNTVWNGRATLQGIWVAHRDASTARRVRISNPATGESVDGALFRRDEAVGGSAIIVSSDAARALGIAPGQPTRLDIVALEKGPPKPERAVTPAAAAAEDAQAAAETPAPKIETEALGTAAEEVAPRAEAAEPRAEDIAPQAETAAPVTATAPVTADVNDAPRAEAPARGEAIPPLPRPRPENLVAAGGAESALPAEDTDTPTADDLPSEGAPGTRPLARKPETAGAGTALDARVSDARIAAIAARAKLEDAEAQAEETPKAEALPDGLPYIQAGIFGVKENVARLEKRIRDAGFPVKTREIKTQDGRSLFRILAGPFETVEGRRDALGKIRRMGVPDASFVKG